MTKVDLTLSAFGFECQPSWSFRAEVACLWNEHVPRYRADFLCRCFILLKQSISSLRPSSSAALLGRFGLFFKLSLHSEMLLDIKRTGIEPAV